MSFFKWNILIIIEHFCKISFYCFFNYLKTPIFYWFLKLIYVVTTYVNAVVLEEDIIWKLENDCNIKQMLEWVVSLGNVEFW